MGVSLKIRIGISLGDGALDSESPDSVLEFIDDCERWNIDSVWVSDRIAAPRPTLDPVRLYGLPGVAHA